MSVYALQAKLCNFIQDHNEILYFFELRNILKNLKCFDMLDVLEKDKDFSFKVKIYLFNRRMGVHND